jgi:hypothetical protein
MPDAGRDEEMPRGLVDRMENREVPDSLLLQKLDKPPAWSPELVL